MMPFSEVPSVNKAHLSVVTWKTPYVVTLETPAFRLLCFRESGNNGILVVPPQAGHHSYIADYKPGQSLVGAALDNSAMSVYAIEWTSCTSDRRNESIEDLLRQVDECVRYMGRAHLIGLCQGGWLSTIYSALHPLRVCSLTIAGAPVNTHVGESVLKQAIHHIPLFIYKQVVFLSGGMMRGSTMLANWKLFNPTTHYIDRYQNPSENTEEFYQWYDLTQNLAGNWYLWCIEKLFKGNLLYKNELTVGGHNVDLKQIRCPVHVVCGDKDDITPPEQSLALLDHVHGHTWMIEDTGHIGVFMGRRSIQHVWNKIFKAL